MRAYWRLGDDKPTLVGIYNEKVARIWSVQLTMVSRSGVRDSNSSIRPVGGSCTLSNLRSLINQQLAQFELEHGAIKSAEWHATMRG